MVSCCRLFELLAVLELQASSIMTKMEKVVKFVNSGKMFHYWRFVVLKCENGKSGNDTLVAWKGGHNQPLGWL